MTGPIRRGPTAALAIALAIVITSCAGTEDGLQSVRDTDRMVYFELPSEWSVFQGDALGDVSATPFVATNAAITLPVVSRVVFQGAGDDAGAPPANTSDSAFPVGSAVVRAIPSSERDFMSRYLLAEAVIAYHQQPTAQDVLKEDISVAEDFDGVQLIVVYSDAESGGEAAVAFISVTDPEVEHLYSIAVGCSADCFIENQDTILDVIDSWVVNTR